ncbi:MAG: TraX family protein [Clostridium sp.]
MQMKTISTSGFTGTTLKLIAMTIMLIDHMGTALIQKGVMSTDYNESWYMVAILMRLVGRLAFPIFAFLLVEGFLHTHDVKRYFLNLAVFAVISEVPFDLAIFDRVWEGNYQNVYFTLAIGLLTLILLDRLENRRILQGVTILLACGTATLLKTDYGALGILMMTGLYLFRKDPRKQLTAGAVIAFIESWSYGGIAALAFIPIRFYYGERGNTTFKYVFYWFYPVHLFLLYIIRCALFG